MFRTATGQTGVGAYAYEAAQIANELRQLNNRFRKLVETVREESPELFKDETDFIFADASDARHFSAYVQGKEDEYLNSLI